MTTALLALCEFPMTDNVSRHEKEYYISDTALIQIEEETKKFPDVETGGILLGLVTDNTTHITHATGPGPGATHDTLFFVKDTPFLQEQLNYMFDYYGINYLGVWHKHPLSMKYPSTGDVSSASEELSSDANNLSELLIPICTLENNNVEIHPFVANQGNYFQISWNTGQIPKSVGQSAQWYTTRSGAARLVEETNSLDNNSIDFELRESSENEYRFYLNPEKDSEKKIILLCPRDYPLAAPSVVIQNTETGESTEYESNIISEWSFKTSLSDIYTDFMSNYSGVNKVRRKPDKSDVEEESILEESGNKKEMSVAYDLPSFDEVKATTAIFILSIVEAALLLTAPNTLYGLAAILCLPIIAKYVILFYYRNTVRALTYSTVMLIAFDSLIFIMGNAYRIGLARPINEIF